MREWDAIWMMIGAGKIRGEVKNEITRKDSTWANPRIDTRKHEELLISAYNCMDNNLPSTQISLKPPKKCEISDGSAYEKGQQKNAQILERLELIPINVTLCVVHFYVNVGWCGGEYAFENFMHQDFETLRAQILVPELDCMQAQMDGTIKPEYVSIQGLDLKLEL